ncbi:hypothetical protein, partial [Thiopseudomonas alkaliphila]|uniref:hypothetical protein n=1 Tax=Thiopseudomonas alkaliphila TaxID=1697053 RepID=UPI0025754DAE
MLPLKYPALAGCFGAGAIANIDEVSTDPIIDLNFWNFLCITWHVRAGKAIINTAANLYTWG